MANFVMQNAFSPLLKQHYFLYIHSFTHLAPHLLCFFFFFMEPPAFPSFFMAATVPQPTLTSSLSLSSLPYPPHSNFFTVTITLLPLPPPCSRDLPKSRPWWLNFAGGYRSKTTMALICEKIMPSLLSILNHCCRDCCAS